MTTALAAGSLDYNGPRQIYTPKPIVIATNSGSGTKTGERTELLIPVPDSQTRVKFSVMFVPTGGSASTNIVGAGTIWVSSQEQDQKGQAGGGGGFYPVNDLEGTAAAPLAFPTSSGLAGYSREFVTIADAIGVQITLDSIGGGPSKKGVWIAQFRIQPFALLFDWESWDQIRRLFDPQMNLPGLKL